MRKSRLVASIMVVGLFLLTISAAVADPNTTLTADPATSNGELTAAVADTSITGRAIDSVSDAVAVSELDPVGLPATVLVEEVDALGVEDWYVTVQMDADLSDGTTTYASSNVTATSTTTDTVVAPLEAIGVVDAVDHTLDDATGLASDGTENALFYVTNQDSTKNYTATYESIVTFSLDLTNYTGPITTLTAPYTVTLYQ